MMKRVLHRNRNGALGILLVVLVVGVGIGVVEGCYGLLDILLVLKRPQGSYEELDMSRKTKTKKPRVENRV